MKGDYSNNYYCRGNTSETIYPYKYIHYNIPVAIEMTGAGVVVVADGGVVVAIEVSGGQEKVTAGI